MTSPKDIQSLISELDSLLPQADSPLPWSNPQDVDHLYRFLVEIRSFLVSLGSANSVAASESLPAAVPQQHQETEEQLLQVVTQQMNCLRADLLAHLQSDLEALRQQRESLVREIQQLEHTQRQLSLLNEQKTIQQQQLISEFSQELINRCTESLRQKLVQILGNWEDRLLSNTSIIGGKSPTPTKLGAVEGVRVSLEASEQLRQMQKHSDQMLSNLDANQRLIFEALQSNLQSYQQSLSQNMAKMQILGSQVEVLFTGLVERLVQQLLPSDLLLATNQMANSQQNFQTLLPNSDLSITEQEGVDLTLGLMLEPNPWLGTELNLQLPQTVESVSTQLEIEINPVANLDSEILNSPQLDIEELYWQNLGIELDYNDEIDTLIQLDIDKQEDALNEYSPFSLIEEQDRTSTSESQAPDSSSHHQEIDDLYTTLFGTDALKTTLPSDKSDSSPLPPLSDSLVDGSSEASEQLESSAGNQSSHSDTFANPNLTFGESETAHEAINGEENSPKLAMSEAPQLEAVNLALLDKLVASTSAEEVLFEGVADPAAEDTSEQTPQWSEEHLGESWEVLFFEESVAELPREGNLAKEAQTDSTAISSLSSRETTSEPAEVETITKLTDLLERMGLNYTPPEEIDDADWQASLLALNTQSELSYSTVETESQSSPTEELYIPASKDEILLVDDELDSTPDLGIVLDENIIEQLSEDLHNFEEDESQALPTQEEDSSPDNQEESSTTAPTENLANQQQLRFSRSEEFLAEDWEELSLHQEGEEIKVIRDETSFNLSTSEASELIESNFEPDLFPPEIPDLDQLNLVNDAGIDATNTGEVGESDSNNTYPTKEVGDSSLIEEEDNTDIPAELLPIDDETFTEIFIEMLQEQPPLDSDSSPEEEDKGR